MARVTFKNPATAIRGKIRGFVFHHMKDDGVIVSRVPNSGKQKPGKVPMNHRGRLRAASRYESETTHLHPIYEELAKAMNLTVYQVALSDRMSPPIVHRILVRDGKILVEASDNVIVAKVEVMVLHEHGTIKEKGEAIQVQGDWWEYIYQCLGETITVAAYDLAGNKTNCVYKP